MNMHVCVSEWDPSRAVLRVLDLHTAHNIAPSQQGTQGMRASVGDTTHTARHIDQTPKESVCGCVPDLENKVKRDRERHTQILNQHTHSL